MKNFIKKTAFLMAITGLVIGATPSDSIANAASPSSTTCNHISCRRTWDASNGGLPRYGFEDYCPLCGTVFGSGYKADGPISMPGGDPGLPGGKWLEYDTYWG